MIIFKNSALKKVFSKPPELETERLVLRKILPSDAEDMYLYSKNPETSKYLLWEPHPSLDFTCRHIALLQKEYAKGEFFDWGLFHKSDKKFIGTCGFTTIDTEKNTAEIGYVISPEYHRMGFAPEAVRKIMEFGFEKMKFDTLFANFMEDNSGSRKVLEKCGFSETKIEEKSLIKRGKKQRIITYHIDKTTYLNK